MAAINGNQLSVSGFMANNVPNNKNIVAGNSASIRVFPAINAVSNAAQNAEIPQDVFNIVGLPKKTGSIIRHNPISHNKIIVCCNGNFSILKMLLFWLTLKNHNIV